MSQLFRSNQDRMVSGVCGGLGERYGVDPTWVRIAFVLATLAGGPGLVLYLVMMFVVPRNRSLTGFEARVLPPAR